jgi:hypothetical protein
VIKSKRIRLVRHMACMIKLENTSRKKQLGRSKHVWEDNIKMVSEK